MNCLSLLTNSGAIQSHIQHFHESESPTGEWGLKTELVFQFLWQVITPMISTMELFCLDIWFVSLSFWMLWISELNFHYNLNSLFPGLKWLHKWIWYDYNSFACSFRWISSDSCIPKLSMINMMMSWPSLALFWHKAYWMQVNVKSPRCIYLFKLNLMKYLSALTIWHSRNWENYLGNCLGSFLWENYS